MTPLYRSLNAEKALIWRIVHRDNIPWLLKNGLHCQNSKVLASHYVTIGNGDLIDKRRHRDVPIAPGGTLADYIPFYFTPFSMMLMNIHTGWNVAHRDNDEIVILVSSLPHIQALGVDFVFTDAHAYLSLTNYYNELERLDRIDWDILQRRDFKRDPNDPRKTERYQAEALVYRHLPVAGLLGLVCHTQGIAQRLQDVIQTLELSLSVHVRPQWYFP
ncbi:MAG: DUF4433 domain-containing protein [Candidatus Competibacter sp.]|nr:DUF4433 domain-containing protein [Candidatus Competibacter sp.]MDS4042606.1 DUF4433 domain-containing protein [Candidatus Competibacter sp.]